MLGMVLETCGSYVLGKYQSHPFLGLLLLTKIHKQLMSTNAMTEATEGILSIQHQ